MATFIVDPQIPDLIEICWVLEMKCGQTDRQTDISLHFVFKNGIFLSVVNVNYYAQMTCSLMFYCACGKLET